MVDWIPLAWMSIQVPDILSFLYLVLMVFLILSCCCIFTNFVQNKPEGRKTVLGNKLLVTCSKCKISIFSALVNVATCQVVSYCTVVLFVAVLMRIVFGPFNYGGVVALHYWMRIVWSCTLSMLTFKTVLKTLFILDFQKMSSVPEHTLMTWMWVVTAICTMAHLVQEAVLRHTLGLHHFGRICFNIYLAKVREIGWNFQNIFNL